MENALTQFSIYKIDYDNFKNIDGLDDKAEDFPIEVRKIIMSDIRSSLYKKEGAEYWEFSKEKITGIIYRTIHEPVWKNMAMDLLVEETAADEEKLNNVNISYILFYASDRKLYVMTGGYGSTLIKDIIEKNWGLYLIPKLLKEDAGVVREVKENALYGNTLSMSKANRNVTDFCIEKELSAVFRELCVEVDSQIAEVIGINQRKISSNKKIGMIFKDSVNIRKSITISELTEIIDKLAKLEEEPDQFILNYLVSVKKAGISKVQLFEQLKEEFQQKKYENFQLIGDDFTRYIVDSAEYLIRNEKDEEYGSDDPISLKDIFEDVLSETRISKALIEKMLKKWTLETRDESGQRILYPRKIEQCLQGHLYYEPKQTMCYLIQGDWYCLDIKYLEQLNTEFADAYDKNKAREEALKDKYKLKSDKKTEDAYNKSFYNRTNVIVGHTALIAKYEIADMFFWDDENLYLMCNKGKFDGSGSRDLTNQIYASAHYMQKMLMSHRRNEFLKELYESIESVYASKKKTLPISFDEFSRLFTKRLCYVAGYLFGYRKESNSYYAKYLTIDLLKKMQQMGFDCVVMNVEGKRG